MISVVIPTHDRPEGLLAALQSVYKQTQLPGEVIVIDDGSSEPVTPEIFKCCPGSVVTRLLRNESPKGANNARNRGIEEASGDWIAFLDDDDEFYPRKLEEIQNLIASSSGNVDVVYHPADIHMVNEGVHYVSSPKDLAESEDPFRTLLISNCIGGTPMATVRRATLKAVGGFDERLPALQDYELWLRLAKHGAVFRLLKCPLTKYHHVTKGKSISKSHMAGLETLAIIEKMYEQDFGRLSRKELTQYRMRKQDMLIHKAYLNRSVTRSFWLNIKALVMFRHPKYAVGSIASLFGPTFVFWLRAKAASR